MRLAEWFVGLLEVYITLGLMFAIIFVWRGVQRVDPAAQSAPLSFRFLLLPGVWALWPLLLRRWLRA